MRTQRVVLFSVVLAAASGISGCAFELGEDELGDEAVGSSAEALMEEPMLLEDEGGGGGGGGSTSTSSWTPVTCQNRCPGQALHPDIDPDSAVPYCNCDPGCELSGTCCPGVTTYCSEPHPLLNSTVVTDPVGAHSHGGVGGWTSTIMSLDQGGQDFGALTSVHYADIDDGSEWAGCDADCASSYGTCRVIATGSSDDQSAGCEGVTISNGSTHSDWGQLRGPEYSVDGYNGSDPYVCAGESYPSSSFGAFLTHAEFKDVDDGSEHTKCVVSYVGGTCGWRLQAITDDDSDAKCKMRIYRLQSGQWLSGTYSTSQYTSQGNTGSPGPVWLNNTSASKKLSENPSTYTNMIDIRDGVCFLTKVHINDVDDGSESAGCDIVKAGGRWQLRPHVRGWDNDLDVDVSCSAQCVNFKSGAVGSWPPEPNYRTTVYGGRLSLYRSLNDGGAYDKPIVFVEGFDPTNDDDANQYFKQPGLGQFFHAALMQGYDVWFLDLQDGGQPIVDSALEIAHAVDRAHRYASWNTTGKQLVLVGASMGGMASRLALAKWESGDYASSLGTDPPVHTFVSLFGPHHGASIPRSLQIAVQDMGDHHDVGESMRAINSAAAANMLRERIQKQCDDRVTDWCDPEKEISSTLTGINMIFQKGLNLYAPWLLGAVVQAVIAGGSWLFGSVWNHGDWGLRDGLHYFNGDECSLDTTGCIDTAGFTCTKYAQPSSAFYSMAQSEGLKVYGGRYDNTTTGFPQSVKTVGIAASGWRWQGCDDGSSGLSSGVCRWDWSQKPYEGSFDNYTIMAEATYDRPASVGFICGINSDIRLQTRSRERQPGDLTGRALNDLSLNLQSGDLRTLQNHSIMFIPTYSALGCQSPTGGDVTSAYYCNQYTRFDVIDWPGRVSEHNSDHNNKNLDHGFLTTRLAGQAFALMADAFDGSAQQAGDHVCEGTETCSNTPQDCGRCLGAYCGDSSCNGSETCSSCAADCGSCSYCGDGSCNGYEDCSTCSYDCGSCGGELEPIMY